MKILFFSRLFHPHIGGVEKHLMEISRSLIKKGHKITVVTEQYSEQLMPKEDIEAIDVFRISNLNIGKFKKFQIWKWLFLNRKLIEDADIIHCHDVFFWYLPFRFLYVKKPVFITFHGYESYPLKQKYIIMHKISEKLSRGNICIGDFIKKWYGTKPTYVTYGAVEISNLSPRGESDKSQISTTVKKESAVFIGRLDEQTGITKYIDAVRLIRKKIPNFNFVVVGDGELRNKISENTKVLGFLENPEKYSRNYHFAFVSRYLSILEAMTAKKLVFAVYDNPLKEDYLRMAPFSKLINIIGSENELSERVLYFLKNPREEKIMVNKAFEWVKTRSWENIAQLYLLLWKKFLY